MNNIDILHDFNNHLIEKYNITIEETNELPETIRGSGGFGSTGK